MENNNPLKRLYDDDNYGEEFIKLLSEYLDLFVMKCDTCEMDTPDILDNDGDNKCLVCGQKKRNV